MKEDVLAVRKKIFHYFKNKAATYEGKISKGLKKYRADQSRYASRPFTASNEEELFESVLNSQIIYIGDFHTFEQNIRNVLRIMRKLAEVKSPYILAIEMVDAKFQNLIDAYHTGFITDLEFLEGTTYHESWRFPWTHYKLLFDEARKHLSNIIGINSEGTLLSRDKFAAKKIEELLEENPDHKIIVFFGEYHICQNKIPDLLEKRVGEEVAATIIHQNLDEVYWKLIEDSENQKIVKFSPHEFCINSSPPWVKYDSMVYWYENLSDDPEFDVHEYIIEKGIKIFGEDTQENFFQLIDQMNSTLKIKLDEDILHDINLYDFRSLEYVEEKIEDYDDKSLEAFYRSLLLTGQSFRLCHEPSFYCSNYSMNRLSYLAGVHIYHSINHDSLKPQKILRGKDGPSKFIYFCFSHMYAHFFSKVINPHRKCDMYIDLKQKMSVLPKAEAIIIRKSLDILKGEELSSVLKNLRLKSLYDTALYVGLILGDYLYEDLIENKDTSKYSLEIDFLSKLPELSHFQQKRRRILSGKDYKNDVKRYF